MTGGWLRWMAEGAEGVAGARREGKPFPEVTTVAPGRQSHTGQLPDSTFCLAHCWLHCVIVTLGPAALAVGTDTEG